MNFFDSNIKGLPLLLSEGLLSYWRFDETSGSTAYDEINGLNLTLVNTSIVDGLLNNGLNFTATKALSYVYSTSFNFTKNDAFTFSLWYNDYKPSTRSDRRIIIKESSATPFNGYCFRLYNNDLQFILVDESTKIKGIQKVGYTIPSGWVHYVFSYDGSDDITGLKIYENGELLSTTTRNNDAINDITSTYPLCIGNWKLGSGNDDRWVDANMDEIGVWNRALSDEEVKILYKHQLGTAFPKHGLLSYWRFDETSGTTLYDSYGSVNGTLGSDTTLNNEGISNKCISVGSGEGLNLGNNYAFERTDTFSFFTWIKKSYSTTDNTFFFSNSVLTAPARGYIFFANQQSLYVMLRNNSSPSNRIYINNVGNIPIGEWCQVGFTYNGNSQANGLSLYINGVLLTPNVISDNLTDTIISTNPLYIGSRSTGEGAQCLIDESGLWNRVLSLDEIKILYNNGLGKFI